MGRKSQMKPQDYLKRENATTAIFSLLANFEIIGFHSILRKPRLYDQDIRFFLHRYAERKGIPLPNLD